MRLNINSFHFETSINRIVKYFIVADLTVLGGFGLVDPVLAIFVIDHIKGTTLITVGIMAAIYWAVNGSDGIYGTSDDFGVDAISLSLGTGAPYVYKGFCDSALPDLTNAIKYAVDRNITVVVAAGNSGGAGISIPGCISYSTTVGAVDSKDKVASFSGRGNTLDITDPGLKIYSDILGNAYASRSGTSMATPMITGVIALMKYAHPTYSRSIIESKLFTTAKDLGNRGKDKDYGWGRVRADQAVQ